MYDIYQFYHVLHTSLPIVTECRYLKFQTTAQHVVYLTNERQNVGRRRHVFGHQHQEDGHRQQRCNAHRDLLAGVTGDVEAEKGNERNDETRHDHVKHVKQRLAPHLNRVGDVRIGLSATRIEADVAYDVQLNERPLGVRNVVGRIPVVSDLLQV